MRRRLIFGAAYVLLIVVIGLTVPFGITLRQRLTDELGGRVEREAFAVAATVDDPLERGQTAGLQPLIGRVARQIGGRVLITDRRGILLADSFQPPGVPPPSYASRPEVARALRGEPNWQVRGSASLGYAILVSAVPIRSPSAILGAVRVSYPMTEVQEAVHRSWAFLGAVAAVALAVGLGLAVWLARWATRPLRDAAAVARRISAGDLRARITVEGPPEVQELARDVNEMTERLSVLLQANREFAATASHQLRTPLTALRLSLEEAREGSDPHSEIGHAIDEVDRLDGVVESLLAVGKRREQAEGTAALRALVDEVAATLPPSAVPIHVSGAGQALAEADRVRQVVSNLLDNGRRFARSKVKVTISRAGDRARITVEDDGPGVPEADRERIFERFYRGASGGTSGSGLGLAVARGLAAVDGGTVTVGRSDLGGARFEVAYPAVAITTAQTPR